MIAERKLTRRRFLRRTTGTCVFPHVVSAAVLGRGAELEGGEVLHEYAHYQTGAGLGGNNQSWSAAIAQELTRRPLGAASTRLEQLGAR